MQTKSSKETEAKLVKEVFAEDTEMEGTLHQVLEKHGFWNTTSPCHVMNGDIYPKLSERQKVPDVRSIDV